MDKVSCASTQYQIDACSQYDSCFLSSNRSFATAYSSICGAGGELDSLKQEFYGVLRIQCILDALTQNDGPSNGVLASPKHDAISACIRKTMDSYQSELSQFNIPECTTLSSPWPSSLASQAPGCLAAGNVQFNVNCSGTQAYAARYYNGITYPQTCTSQCCYNLPRPYAGTAPAVTTYAV
jgi:hypothetical protein